MPLWTNYFQETIWNLQGEDRKTIPKQVTLENILCCINIWFEKNIERQNTVPFCFAGIRPEHHLPGRVTLVCTAQGAMHSASGECAHGMAGDRPGGPADCSRATNLCSVLLCRASNSNTKLSILASEHIHTQESYGKNIRRWEFSASSCMRPLLSTWAIIIWCMSVTAESWTATLRKGWMVSCGAETVSQNIIIRHSTPVLHSP